ncbi:response regulator [Chitinimonas sp. PSY-7]|uniref:response regulator n=1 Tax=Chitinimonas sp. PSY-7 TaxID=3459088 RepID=UPI00403FEA8F
MMAKGVENTVQRLEIEKDGFVSKQVLIVDDSRVSRMLVRGYLEESRPNWRCFEASSGEDAIALVQKESIDLVTMDINMPGMSGLVAGERILQLRPKAQVVVLSANIQAHIRQKAEAMGMQFLSKPVTAATIAQLLEMTE